MNPAWGPPSSLSPEKQTTPAPAAMLSCTMGSWARPNRAVSNSAPLPKIVDDQQIVPSWPRPTSSATSTPSVKPTTRKLEV